MVAQTIQKKKKNDWWHSLDIYTCPTARKLFFSIKSNQTFNHGASVVSIQHHLCIFSPVLMNYNFIRSLFFFFNPICFSMSGHCFLGLVAIGIRDNLSSFISCYGWWVLVSLLQGCILLSHLLCKECSIGQLISFSMFQ